MSRLPIGTRLVILLAIVTVLLVLVRPEDAGARSARDRAAADPVELIGRVRHDSNGYIALLERSEAYQALERSQEALAHELAQAAAYVRSLLPPPGARRVDTLTFVEDA